MADMNPMERLQETLRMIRREGGLEGLMIGLVGGTFITVAFNLWEFIESFGQTIILPFVAFGESLATLIRGSIGGPVLILEAAVETAVVSLTEGLFATFGLFAYPIAMLSVMAGIWIFARAWNMIELSPWGFLRSLRR